MGLKQIEIAFIFIIKLLLLSSLFSCNPLGSRTSLNMEKTNINEFFQNHQFPLKIEKTENIENTRIFLHEFRASENQIREMINILQLDSVTEAVYNEFHTGDYVRTQFEIFYPVGKDYFKNPDILFYKCEDNNKKAQSEIKATKVYLYYNKKTQRACFQIYYGWG